MKLLVPSIGFVCTAAFLSGIAAAGEKRVPEGRLENDSVLITATVLTADQVKQEFGATTAAQYTVLDVHVTPKGGKQVGVHLDDFLLRSESDGDHSGPMVAAQIAGDGALVVSRTYAPRSNPEMPQILEGTRVRMRKGGGDTSLLDSLKKRILAEGNITSPESGLLFFPLQKEKPKNLVLSYIFEQQKLRTEFK